MFTLVAGFSSLGAPHRLFVGAILVLANCVVAAAQIRSVTDGYTPLGLAPGAPAGSYGLSGFENVNPYNGGLNFSLPIKQVSGRGGASSKFRLRTNGARRSMIFATRNPDSAGTSSRQFMALGATSVFPALTALEYSWVEGQGSAFNRKVSDVTITKTHTSKRSRD